MALVFVKIFLVVVLLSTDLAWQSLGLELTGGGKKEYLVRFEKFEVLPSDYLDTTNLKLIKKSKTLWVLGGFFELLQDAPEGMTGSAWGYRKMGTGYVKQAVGFENMDACKGYDTDDYLAPEIKASTNITDLCPIKKGVYYVHDYVPNVEKLPENIPEGEYKIEVTGSPLDSTEILGGFAVYFSLAYKT